MSFIHNHRLSKIESVGDVTFKSRDENLMRVLQQFMSLVRGKRSRGLVYNATRYLEAQLPGRNFAENVVRNSLQHIQNLSNEAQNLVTTITEMKMKGEVDFFSYRLSVSGVLEYIAWAPKGAKELVNH